MTQQLLIALLPAFGASAWTALAMWVLLARAYRQETRLLKAALRSATDWADLAVRTVARHNISAHRADEAEIDLPDPDWINLPIEPEGTPWLDVIKRP